MNTKFENTNVDAKIDNHILRWRRIITSPTSTNKEMAEQGVNDLYAIVKGRKPKAILWCRSPYQLAVIPPMVKTVIEDQRWQSFCSELKNAGDASSPTWNDCWDAGWHRLREEFVEDVADAVMLSRALRTVPEVVLESAFKVFELHMRILAPLQQTKLERNWQFVKHILAVNNKVEQAAGLKLSANVFSLSAPVMGVWDKRILTQFVPITEKVLGAVKHDEATTMMIERTHKNMIELRALSMSMFNWFTSMIVAPSTQQNEPVRQEPKPPNAVHGLAFWVPYCVEWLPFALACRLIDPNMMRGLDAEIDCWGYLTHGAIGYVFADDVCFACEKPAVFRANEDTETYAVDPYAVWPDGLQKGYD